MISNLKVLIILIILTIISALVAFNSFIMNYISEIIIVLAVLKFYGVVFYFMELRKAHSFWKLSILLFIFLFGIITINIL
ncbi:MAG: cytochrome C oxidase subunit IV family protein [Flavobacteriaceae bacterium]|nr:cytochrome C oxidase subunit IV family protein [Flavobacteriaceae bacterium]